MAGELVLDSVQEFGSESTISIWVCADCGMRYVGRSETWPIPLSGGALVSAVKVSEPSYNGQSIKKCVHCDINYRFKAMIISIRRQHLGE